jgi:glycosyltransferase involved in cell wall biosynthesis
MFAHDVEVKGLRQADQSRVLLFFLLRKFVYIIITQNKYQHDTLIHEYGCENIIIYNGFEIKKRNIVKNKKNYILWVARCDSWKQPEVFVQLAKNNPYLQFCMICPQSQDESFFKNIKKQALMIKNDTFINFVPYNEIDKFFEHALIFVNTSLYEGFPQTFIQATMNGVPIVTLHVNPENFLDTFQCGYCCNGDVELLNNKIKELTGVRKKI